MKEIKKINNIIDSMSKNIDFSEPVNKKQKLLIIEMLYLLLSSKEFAQKIQEHK